MWKIPRPLAAPWRRLAVASHERAVAHARSAATDLSRLLVERAEVELYLERHRVRRTAPAAGEGRPA